MLRRSQNNRGQFVRFKKYETILKITWSTVVRSNRISLQTEGIFNQKDPRKIIKQKNELEIIFMEHPKRDIRTLGSMHYPQKHYLLRRAL